MYKIFLVEDDETIAKMVKNHLEKWDYEVRIAQKFDRIMAGICRLSASSLSLWNIGLPFYNGYHWCTQIRKVSNVPVVFLSSAADQYEYCDGSYNGGG